jgi:hypothetical protein
MRRKFTVFAAAAMMALGIGAASVAPVAGTAAAHSSHSMMYD